MWLAAALITVVCFGTNNLLFKWGVARRLSNAAIQFCFNSVAFAVLLVFGLVTGSLHVVPLAVLLGVLMGCLNVTGNLEMTRAFENGPASLISPLVAGNTMIPVLASALLFHESITPLHWVGILLILGSVAAMQYKPGEKTAVESGHWLGRVTAAILCFGAVSTLMKVASSWNLQSLDVLTAMYAGGALFMAPQVRRDSFQPLVLRTGVAAGFLSCIGYWCYFYAVDTGIASVVFPAISLNCLVVMAGGYFLFAERLQRYQLVGVGTALLGLILTRI